VNKKLEAEIRSASTETLCSVLGRVELRKAVITTLLRLIDAPTECGGIHPTLYVRLLNNGFRPD
jgi:hypothetical protein